MEIDSTPAGRAGRREANLRLLNERIADAGERLGSDAADAVEILCECARDRCDDVIEIAHDQFERLREEVDCFAVVDGHVLHDVEHVIERHGSWLVVRKHGKAAEEAARRLS